jgi:hypothetical protein
MNHRRRRLLGRVRCVRVTWAKARTDANAVPLSPLRLMRCRDRDPRVVLRRQAIHHSDDRLLAVGVDQVHERLARLAGRCARHAGGSSRPTRVLTARWMPSRAVAWDSISSAHGAWPLRHSGCRARRGGGVRRCAGGPHGPYVAPERAAEPPCAGRSRAPREYADARQDLHHLRGTSEIQRMIIGRAVTGLDVR